MHMILTHSSIPSFQVPTGSLLLHPHEQVTTSKHDVKDMIPVFIDEITGYKISKPNPKHSWVSNIYFNLAV